MTNYTNTIGYWIKQYVRLANRAVDIELMPYGIGRTQWYILHHVHEAGQLSQRRLQELLQVESATLTNLIAGLERKALISRRPDAADKRGRLVMLTAKGRSVWRQLPDPIQTVRATALRGIAQADIDTARTVLEAAVRNLEERK